MKLEILRGVPASGKSTHAVLQQEKGYTVVNRDSIRYAMYGRYFGGNINEDVVTDVENAAIESALRAKDNVVVDATNLRNKALKAKLSLASRYGAEVEFRDFPIGLDRAISRDYWRKAAGDRAVGSGVIRKFFERYKINQETGVLPPAPDVWPNFEPYTISNNQLPIAFIVDTDGTVANHEGIRNPYDETKYHLDTVHLHVRDVVRALYEKAAIIGLSGRDAAYREVTENWWHDRDIPFDAFFMRPVGDKRVDAVVKYELFKEYIEPNYFVAGAFDDRPQVIRMWRTIGVPVFDVGTGLEF